MRINYNSGKHRVVMEILNDLNLSNEEEYFSKGGTVTKKALIAIREAIQNNNDILTRR